MTLKDSEKLLELSKRVGSFAHARIASVKDLDRSTSFPPNLWREMAREGLFGIGLPVEAGGSGHGWPGVLAAGEALVTWGGNLGVALSWMLHVIVARHVLCRHGGDRHAGVVRELAAGGKTACLAVSEPKVGAHPKHLKATARQKNGKWVLNGEKTYLTNGPIADFYCVVAATGEHLGKKEFSAFLVSRHAEGLEVGDPMELDFLRPSPHGGITLRNCRVGEEAMIGRQGAAYTEMVKPFREVEDVAMCGPILGALCRQARLCASMLQSSGGSVDEEDQLALGRFRYLIDAVRVVALEAASALEETDGGADATSLVLACRDMVEQTQSLPRKLAEECGADDGHELPRLTRELTMVGGIAKNVSLDRQKKLGNAMIAAR
ncbi:MAG: acyl-CoA dehydrogenase family protein [Desulfatibacillaceae bacterium]